MSKPIGKTEIIPVHPITGVDDTSASIDELLESCGFSLSDTLPTPHTAAPQSWDWSKLPLVNDRYEIVSPLAHGGMGALFIAMDRLLSRKVALKILHESHLEEPIAVLRFFQEARIHSQLHHTGIPPLHDVGRFFDGRPFLAMKYIEGKTFFDVLQSRESTEVDPAQMLAIFDQICRIVAYAHAKGVIHRDLTPNNVLISKRGEVQVIDWGLAKVVHPFVKPPSEGAGRLGVDTTVITIQNLADTAQGAALGTPAFIPPEQANGQLDLVDQRSDVFGLGAILCHILTGSPPYTGELSEVRKRSKTGNLQPALKRLEQCEISAGWVLLTKECLSVEKAERPLNASEVSRRVSELLQSPLTKPRPWWRRLFGTEK